MLAVFLPLFKHQILSKGSRNNLLASFIFIKLIKGQNISSKLSNCTKNKVCYNLEHDLPTLCSLFRFGTLFLGTRFACFMSHVPGLVSLVIPLKGNYFY